MKMQFEQMRDRGEPSEDMVKDMDYIRQEVEAIYPQRRTYG